VFYGIEYRTTGMQRTPSYSIYEAVAINNIQNKTIQIPIPKQEKWKTGDSLQSIIKIQFVVLVSFIPSENPGHFSTTINDILAVENWCHDNYVLCQITRNCLL